MKPPKTSCYFFSNEVARRICPAIHKPISSRACAELFNAEIVCANSCPHLGGNFSHRMERLYRRGAPRIIAEYPDAPPRWMNDNPVLAYFLAIEHQLARYGQYYPELTDKECLTALDEFRATQSAVLSKLIYNPPPFSSHCKELYVVLSRATGLTLKTAMEMPVGEVNEMQKAIDGAVEQIRESARRRESQGPRAYLDFIISFADKHAPLPRPSKIIIPGDTREESWRERIVWEQAAPEEPADAPYDQE